MENGKFRDIPFIKIKAGNNYDFGYAVGSRLKIRIQDRVLKNRELFKRKAVKARDFSIYVKKAKKFIPSIKKNFPHLLQEARGLADGADIKFDEFLANMVDDEIIDFKILHCISIALKTEDNQFLLGNNEDWFPEYKRNGLMLVKGEIKNNKFLGLGYVGKMIGSACGLNKYGLAYTDNSFVLNKFVYGVPRTFQLRSLLDAKNDKEAIKNLDKHGSLSSNTMISYKNVATSVEEYFNHHRLYKTKDLMVHTNHPLEKKYQNKKNTEMESIVRYNRAYEILRNEKNLTANSLKKVFSDHKVTIVHKLKVSICEHADKAYMNYCVATIGSVIMNPGKKIMMVCHGNPCKEKYKEYKL